MNKQSETFEEDVIILNTDFKKPNSNAKVLVTRLHGFDLHEASVDRVLTESRLNCEVVNCYIEYVGHRKHVALASNHDLAVY